MTKDKHDINKEPDKSEGGSLARLWRSILRNNNMLNINTVEFLANRYVKNTAIVKSEIKNISRKTRGSIINNITATDMTWKVFLDLLFNVLNVAKITITIKLTHANGSESLSSIVINDTNNIGKGEDDEGEYRENSKRRNKTSR